MGASTAWRLRHLKSTRLVVMLTVAASALYAESLVPAYVGVRSFITYSIWVVSALALCALGASFPSRLRAAWMLPVGLALSSLALLLGSAWASATAVNTGLGPFDSPYESASIVYSSQIVPGRERALWPQLNESLRHFPSAVSVIAIHGSGFAGYDIFATGKEYFPIGGFSGQVPAPSLSEFVGYVNQGRIRRVDAAVDPLSPTPVIRWVVRNCSTQDSGNDSYTSGGTRFQLYTCGPSDTPRAEQP
jgi:hypothetical protein